mmetsp:Transcript_38250/g.61671  ORF Transcript_38250/g.61671 Transcript_38250/m.61671 type:complete len:223 (+) Transcript_38250:108-776(+)
MSSLLIPSDGRPFSNRKARSSVIFSLLASPPASRSLTCSEGRSVPETFAEDSPSRSSSAGRFTPLSSPAASSFFHHSSFFPSSFFHHSSFLSSFFSSFLSSFLSSFDQLLVDLPHPSSFFSQLSSFLSQLLPPPSSFLSQLLSFLSQLSSFLSQLSSFFLYPAKTSPLLLSASSCNGCSTGCPAFAIKSAMNLASLSLPQLSKKVYASPVSSALPVRPMRWT